MSTENTQSLSFPLFAKTIYPSLSLTTFHNTYYKVLDLFAHGKIRKLIVTMPPQHGKSVGASVLLPAYMVGLDPDNKIAIASYSATLASRFNRRVQRIIESDQYTKIFPETTIKSGNSPKTSFVRTADHVEIIGHNGEIISVGREGSLTGNQVDIFMLDDLYKDAMEANSPVIRENCWEWYTSVVKTRTHNDSSELVVFTRWHEEDLVGKIAEREEIVELENWSQLEQWNPEVWVHLRFEAIKESPASQIDPRKTGEALWPERHSAKLLQGKRNLSPLTFEALYQGKPSNKDGLLYGENFMTYSTLPSETIRKANYTDTADMGDDFLCSVCYEVGPDSRIYVTDIVYSQAKMEVTEKLVGEMLNRNLTRNVLVESNNGGRGFARAIARTTPLARIEWFHQSAGKEARILSNPATVLRNIVMPADWATRWSDFHRHLTTYRRAYKSNRWHDAADVLTGIVEREIVDAVNKRIKAFGFATGE